MRRIHRLLQLSPWKIAGSFIAIGVIWILVSDRVVQMIAGSQAVVLQYQTVKGWLFVLGSGLLILGLALTRARQVEETNQ